MIARQHRFHGYNSLHFVYKHGISIRDHHLTLRIVENRRRSTYRVAVIVSRKVHKSAIRRNRIRRRLYEIVRQYEPYLDKPYDIVVTVFNDQVAEEAAPALQERIVTLFLKADIFIPIGSSESVEKRAIVQ